MVDVAVLLVSELVANAVLHAHTPIRVVLRLNGALLRVEVHDGDRRTPTRKHYSALATTGRGLFLVERLARDWGVSTNPTGKSVWFELDARTAAAADSDAGLLGFDLEDDVEAFGTTAPATGGRNGGSAGRGRARGAGKGAAPPRGKRGAELRLVVGAGR